MSKTLSAFLGILVAQSVLAEQNQIDIVRHDAPELAYFGDYDIGVQTLRFSNADQADILSTDENAHTPQYSRRLTVEIWYPAELDATQEPGGSYVTSTRNLAVTATLHGKAVRNAATRPGIGPLPLVVISHGYPGNRYLMSHLAENLASKGYVVASIDHPDSTYEDQSTIWSTLYHRPLDQLFVINEITLLSKTNDSFLNNLVDSDTVGIVGYSMGGYGLLVNMGAGYNDATAASAEGLPGSIATRHAASNPEFPANSDPRIKAGIAIAPCCMNRGMWDPSSLENITNPLLLMVGSADDTAGYANGVRPIFEYARRSDRYLLTFLNAGHNAIAPIPLPVEIHESEDQAGAFHYTDAVWDSIRSSNVMTHFATAFFDYHLKNDVSRLTYLDIVPNAEDGIWSIEDDKETDAHSYWPGFPRHSARGLVLEHLPPAN